MYKRQDINVENLNLPEADIIAGHQINGQTCVQVFFFRAGRNYGNRAYFPRHDKSVPLSEVLTAFIGQFYADKTPPRLILSSQQLPENAVLCAALSVKANHKIQIVHPKRGARKKIVQHAVDNARDAMERRLAEKTTNEELLKKAADTGNPEARYRILEEAERLFLSERPILPLYWYTRNYLIHQELKGWNPLILDNHPYKFLKLERNPEQ